MAKTLGWQLKYDVDLEDKLQDMLEYNKLYQSLKKVSAEWHAGHVQWQYSWNYLKFFEDGTFLYCSSPQKPEQLDWFNATDFHEKKGSFTIKNHLRIEGIIPVAFGELVLEGSILENELILYFHNDKSHFKGWDHYELVR